jgi:hypothetical protein
MDIQNKRGMQTTGKDIQNNRQMQIEDGILHSQNNRVL